MTNLRKRKYNNKLNKVLNNNNFYFFWNYRLQDSKEFVYFLESIGLKTI